MNEKVRVSIVIDGESAKELFSIGPNDLLDFFLPNRLNVNQGDVKHIIFEEDTTNKQFVDTLVGKRKSFVHKDNYVRKGESK